MLKVKALTPPRGTLSPAAYRRAIQNALGIAETAGLSEARSTTRSWRHKPRWSIERQSNEETHIVTDDEVFHWQDQGTRGPYTIRPRLRRALYWKGARHPVKHVRHPGLKAQRFTDKIAARLQKQYVRIVQAELARVTP